MKGYFTKRQRVWFYKDAIHLESNGSEVTIELRDLDLAVEMLMRIGNDLTGYKDIVHSTKEETVPPEALQDEYKRYLESFEEK